MATLEDLSVSQRILLKCLFHSGTLDAAELSARLEWSEERVQDTLDILVAEELVEKKFQKKHIVNTIEDHTGLKHKIQDVVDVVTYRSTVKAQKARKAS